MEQTFKSDGAKAAKVAGVKERLSHAQNALIDDGKSSFETGLNVAAGQAALAVLRSFVVPAKVSLVDRLTGKGAIIKKIAHSTYGSLAIAATFHTVTSIICPNNTKLRKVAQLALDAAVVEAAATLPIQKWVDTVADKLFNMSAVAKVLGNDKDTDKND